MNHLKSHQHFREYANYLGPRAVQQPSVGQLNTVRHIMRFRDNPWKMLNLSSPATAEQIKQAFENIRYALVEDGVPLDEVEHGCTAHGYLIAATNKLMVWDPKQSDIDDTKRCVRASGVGAPSGGDGCHACDGRKWRQRQGCPAHPYTLYPSKLRNSARMLCRSSRHNRRVAFGHRLKWTRGEFSREFHGVTENLSEQVNEVIDLLDFCPELVSYKDSICQVVKDYILLSQNLDQRDVGWYETESIRELDAEVSILRTRKVPSTPSSASSCQVVTQCGPAQCDLSLNTTSKYSVTIDVASVPVRKGKQGLQPQSSKISRQTASMPSQNSLDKTHPPIKGPFRVVDGSIRRFLRPILSSTKKV